MKQNSRIGLTLLILQNVSILLTAITFFYFWGGRGELGYKYFIKRAETLKHCRKLCFNIYWKANCKKIRSFRPTLVGTMWVAVVYKRNYEEKTKDLHTVVQWHPNYCPVTESGYPKQSSQCPRHRALPKVISFPELKEVCFLGGAPCRFAQRLQTLVLFMWFCELRFIS